MALHCFDIRAPSPFRSSSSRSYRFEGIALSLRDNPVAACRGPVGERATVGWWDRERGCVCVGAFNFGLNVGNRGFSD